MLCPRDLTREASLSMYIYIHTLYYHTHEKLLTPTGYLTAARTDNTTINSPLDTNNWNSHGSNPYSKFHTVRAQNARRVVVNYQTS